MNITISGRAVLIGSNSICSLLKDEVQPPRLGFARTLYAEAHLRLVSTSDGVREGGNKGRWCLRESPRGLSCGLPN